MTHILLAIIYLSFISLGLPDGVLGAAWPAMQPGLQVPVSYLGILTVIISIGTIVSSLSADRLTHRFGTGRVMVFSVAATALALLGFSVSSQFWMLCLLAIPYGFGAGSVDASLNNYVALHYASRHMSWLHCMWGVGAAVGPYILGGVLAGGKNWSGGFWTVGILQAGITAILILSLPIWKGQKTEAEKGAAGDAYSLKQILGTLGAKEVMVAFFCYCALEQTAGQWASSYFVLKEKLAPEEAANLASLFYIGITLGRVASGFLTMRFSNKAMVRGGQCLIGIGAGLIFLGRMGAILGLVLIGLGCAPVYPCIIHSTPARFGEKCSQAMMGVEMASAYLGSMVMPPVYGILANHINAALLPVYLLGLLCLMIYMSERLNRVTEEV